MINKTLRNLSIKYGVLFGVINILIALLFYIIGYERMIDFWVIGLVLAIGIGMIVFSAIQTRKENGGYVDFTTLFIALFLIMFISGGINAMFSMVLFHVIDPELDKVVETATINKTIAMLERFDVPESDIDDAIEKAKAGMEGQYSIASISISFVKTLVWYAILSAVAALIFKRKEPIFDEIQDANA